MKDVVKKDAVIKDAYTKNVWIKDVSVLNDVFRLLGRHFDIFGLPMSPNKL